MPDIKTITSHANPLIKKLKSLSLKKHRDEWGVFVVEGLRHINEAIDAGWVLQTLVFSARAHATVVALVDPCFKSGGEVIETTDDILCKITGRENTQPVLGVFKQRWLDLETVAKGGLWIGLENVRDPGNLGTIVRTCDAVGAEGVLLIGQTCDPWSPEAVRASMGSFARSLIARATQREVMTWRRSYGGKIVGTHLDATQDYRDISYEPPMILMMGGESDGLTQDMSDMCSALVKIPMRGPTESLNLAVASGIMLYETVKNRIKN